MKHFNYLLIIAFVLAACTGNGVNRKVTQKNAENVTQPDRYVKSIRLKSPLREDIYADGQRIPVIVEPRRKRTSIDSIQFVENGKLLHTLTSKPWTYDWLPRKGVMGKRSLQVLAYHSDGQIGRLTSVIKLKSSTPPQKYKITVVRSFPHDTRAYTQGLLFHRGCIWEGTGQRGESSLRKVNLESGEVLAFADLEKEYFGEGITVYQNQLVQLTWTSGKAFVYSDEDLSRNDTFYLQSSNGQGWGITTMNDEFVISDGSNMLTVLDADSFSRKRTIEVFDDKGEVKNLNELEYINGQIYANVWLTNRIVIIDPASGRVTGDINLKGLLTPAQERRLIKGDDVLNGIAWDSMQNRLFVTGKRWPRLFEIQLEKR